MVIIDMDDHNHNYHLNTMHAPHTMPLLVRPVRTKKISWLDAEYDSFVTSWVCNSWILAVIRLVFAAYAVSTLVFLIIYKGAVTHDAQTMPSYFTYLTYTGICVYFWISGILTLSHARHSSYSLQSAGRLPQFLYSFLWVTVTTFPPLVTTMFWVFLAKPTTLNSPFKAFENVSVHALNTLFASFEIFCTNVGPQSWFHIPGLVVILAGYLGIVYITHATQGFYPYTFLDPEKKGPKVALFIVGIPLIATVFFVSIRGICYLKHRWLGYEKQNIPSQYTINRSSWSL